ncbi:MAG: histidine--tRNA ligase [Rickettsiales bacterium]|jgi:histidyl-tRNA synthetase|nr:histidine--tRNA ligase [Rickettsiales bacterium]
MSDTLNTRAMSGFVELLPRQQAVFDKAKAAVLDEYRSHGFAPIETPAIDRAEILFSKAGGEMEKEIYRVAKTGRDDLALRFDLTVPMARYIAEHAGEITFPFKCSQIGRSYRGERAQKGRYREFYQADIDIVAENSLDTAYDAEVIATAAAAVRRIAALFGLGGFTVRVSNRQAWTDFFAENAVPADTAGAVLALLDRKLKMPPEDFERALDAFGPLAPKIRALTDKGAAAHPDLARAMELLAMLGVPAKADLSIVRGLDYYTGSVFETFFDDRPELGSVASGGRYANLVSRMSRRNIIGAGGSIGLSRLLVPIIEKGEFPLAGPDAAIIPVSPAQAGAAMQTEHRLALGGAAASAFLNGASLKKNMELANKSGARFVLIVGEDECKSGQFTLKNMLTGEQGKHDLDGILEKILAGERDGNRFGGLAGGTGPLGGHGLGGLAGGTAEGAGAA